MIDQRIITQFNARAPFKLQDATLLVLAQIGSHSHGTYCPPTDPQAIDDVDYMGIVIPPLSYTIGLKNWEGLNFQFEELDCVFYSFKKFVTLLMKANPNVIGLLWLRPEFYINQSKEWNLIVSNRDKFSSKLAYPSFMGYAHSQMRKMTHFDLAAANEYDFIKEGLEDLGLVFSEVVKPNYTFYIPVEKRVERFGLKGLIGNSGNFYSQDVIHSFLIDANKIQSKYFAGYMGEKRKALVRKYGFDTKNAAHLIRLMTMCVEFLSTRVMNVYREDDGDYIRAIKSGKYTLEEVKNRANELFELAVQEKSASLLPDEPDTDAIDRLTIQVHLSAYQLDRFDFSY